MNFKLMCTYNALLMFRLMSKYSDTDAKKHNVVSTHCFIHQEAITSKILQDNLYRNQCLKFSWI